MSVRKQVFCSLFVSGDTEWYTISGQQLENTYQKRFEWTLV